MQESLRGGTRLQRESAVKRGGGGIQGVIETSQETKEKWEKGGPKGPASLGNDGVGEPCLPRGVLGADTEETTKRRGRFSFRAGRKNRESGGQQADTRSRSKKGW